MAVAIVTGAAGLIGSEAVRVFSDGGFQLVGIDNDMRRQFFGDDASTRWNQELLVSNVSNYQHRDIDIRDEQAVASLFNEFGSDIEVIIHTAAQPSHDWAANEPLTDFSINATGTLLLLENARRHCPGASFIFTSTNKVYGDNPNKLPLVELETRWEIDRSHPYFEHGIDEQMSVDHTTHSLFGVSKLAADALVQEYGRYFGMNTVCFRGGCLTGPSHSGTKLHGFLSYLVKCAVTGTAYTMLGYKGKQVRDNIHSADLIQMFWQYHQSPRVGEVYNAGGGRLSNCSILEAVQICEEQTGKRMNVGYAEENRKGDHIWYVSDTRKFQCHYPGWSQKYDIRAIIQEIVEAHQSRL